MLEAAEIVIWETERPEGGIAEEEPPDEDEEARMWASAERAAAASSRPKAKPKSTGDALVDHWNAELAAGRTPDLGMR